jgi:Ca-activated chloride channel family protein
MTTNCPRKTLLLIITQIFLLLGGPAFAQDPPLPNTPAAKQGETPPKQAPAAKDTPKDKGQTVIHITTRTVVVPVTVKDHRGNLVPDLQRDEFRIFEDGVEQNISYFTSVPVPLSIVVLISNDLKQKDADQVEPSLRAIVGGMSTNDEAYIARFDQTFHEGTGFVKDQDKLIVQLKRTQISSESSAPPPGDPFHGPVLNGGAIAVGGAPAQSANDTGQLAIKGQSTTALDDAVYGAATVLQSRPTRDRRKVILLISDGQNGPKMNTHSYDEVRAELLKQEISVYSVATGSAYFDRKFNRLVSYAHDTGGDVYFGAKQNSFSEFYAQICEEARNQYVLYFEPRGDSKVDYHPIEVRVRREGLTILAREGYYGGTFATVPPK